MCEVKINIADSVLTICLDGRVDSTNSPDVEKTILSQVQSRTDLQWVIDADKLEYISSAGLRVILRLKKLNKTLKITNVCSDVYDVFDMTGFTEMMTIEKAYRRLSVEGCETIGFGSNGVVYRLDADTIIKVYRNPDSLPEIHRERELARTAFVSGVPTAIPYDVVRVGDSYGSVFELLNARAFSKIYAQEPERRGEIIEKYVELLKTIHSTPVNTSDMPDEKQVAVDWVEYLEKHLPADIYTKLHDMITAVPDCHTMLHGDCHLKNLMMQNGETLLIDMDTLCYGHPVFEFASIYLAYKGFGALDPSVTLKFHGIDQDTAAGLWDATVKAYFGTDDEEQLKYYVDKAEIIGLVRLLRRTIKREPENTAMIEYCKGKLLTLVPQVDSLYY